METQNCVLWSSLFFALWILTNFASTEQIYVSFLTAYIDVVHKSSSLKYLEWKKNHLSDKRNKLF